jgi:hypothetical protein
MAGLFSWICDDVSEPEPVARSTLGELDAA